MSTFIQKKTTSPKASKSSEGKKKGKEARKWDSGKVSKKDAAELDFSNSKPETQKVQTFLRYDLWKSFKTIVVDQETKSLKNKCRDIQGLEVEEINLDTDDIPAKSGSVFGMFKGLISQKELTAESMQPILEQYRSVWSSKNESVAAFSDYT